jgi:two-component system OmpR family response regulator
MPSTPLNRVLYVEDDEDVQRIVRLSLERIGKMTVRVVSDPLQAIEAIRQFGPELVMLDWMMPGMDGPTLFRKMRELPETRDCPVVFITARAQQRETAELAALGAAGVISKPFSPKDLPDQLRSIWSALP